MKFYLIIYICLYFFIFFNLYANCFLHSFFDSLKQNWIDKFDCEPQILKQKYSSGSLFKIFIVSAGLYYHVIPERDIPYINQKMFESNNEYFKNLLKKIQNKRMIQFLNTQLQKYFNYKTISIKDFQSDFSFVHGGTLKFYPEEIQNWFKFLAFDKNNYMQLALQTIKRNEKSFTYYGKSGTWGGAAWFCGILELDNVHIICTLNPYKEDWKTAKLKSEHDFLNKLKELLP